VSDTAVNRLVEADVAALVTVSFQRLTPAFRPWLRSGPEGLKGRWICRHGEDLLPAAVVQRDQEDLVDVELAALTSAAGAVDGDGVVTVGERPAELAEVGALGEPSRLAEELEDRGAAVHLAGDGRRAGDAPDGVLGDHLDERASIASAKRVEDPVDVVDRAQRSSGAIVRP
jgi:hypothetical protein